MSVPGALATGVVLPDVIGEITLKGMRAKGNRHWTDLSFVELLLAGLFILLLLVLAILLSPIIVPYLFYLYIRSKIENREFEKYIRSNEGARTHAYQFPPGPRVLRLLPLQDL
jgi:hypothetical protein